MTEPLRIGVLGAARISQDTLFPPAEDIGARIVAVAARDADKAKAYAHEHGIERTAGSYQELVEDPEIEAIYNPLPNGLHTPWNLAAIGAGKHLLAEKPFASNAAEALQVHEAAAAKPELVVFNGFHYSYHPVFLRFLEILRSGEIGDIQFVRAVMTVDVPDLQDIRWSWPLAGGALMDVGCYVIDAIDHVARELGGAAKLTSTRTGHMEGTDPRVDAWAELAFELPNGVHAVAEANLVGPRDFTLTAVGSKGSIHQCNLSYVHTDDRLIVTTAAGTRVENLGLTRSFTYQLRAFRDAIRSGADYPTTTAAAVRNMRVIDQAYEMAGLPLRPSVSV
ncbi:Gfo/Idh/MocA family oxidoreductase [Leucobacter weissii]|uniref:Gfo/Idh/MocA family oxidoreductase n=1 Tax=Leucobacter weissii TaxID=1983706 RepID=A0A939MIW1_9MICO|nr:Gfo/Idh/MocA family oxidoreductase [Leucobacter weissii]MBO1901553.1 Gfo/Idh/MocA family oxidoreductase [Leucobacter weissii]